MPNRWIGRGGHNDWNISWPMRSPNLSPMNFFVWGFVKIGFYNRNSENEEDLIKEFFPGIEKKIKNTLKNN